MSHHICCLPVGVTFQASLYIKDFMTYQHILLELILVSIAMSKDAVMNKVTVDEKETHAQNALLMFHY